MVYYEQLVLRNIGCRKSNQLPCAPPLQSNPPPLSQASIIGTPADNGIPYLYTCEVNGLVGPIRQSTSNLST